MTANIAKALAAAQSQMGKARKDTQNPHFRSKYADLSSVADACMGALNANGIAVIQPLRETDQGRFVVTIFLHESGEALECPVPLILGKNDMQGLGSAVTYARRYGLMSLAGIAPDDDDGHAAAQSVRAERDEPRPDPIAQANAFAGRVQAALTALKAQKSLADLGLYWADLNKNERAVAADAAVIRAKDARKAELVDPITADEIPY